MVSKKRVGHNVSQNLLAFLEESKSQGKKNLAGNLYTGYQDIKDISWISEV